MTRVFDTDPERATLDVWRAFAALQASIAQASDRMELGFVIEPMRQVEIACRNYIAVVDASYGPGGCDDPACRGWAHFNLGDAREGIQRCDQCDAFAGDDDALIAHDQHCRCGMGVDKVAERCHLCAGPAKDVTGWLAINEQLLCPDCQPKEPT